ncbi:MAG: hypothetical protein Q7O66_15950, partial [Dehalococcoidia bacterium]|nr:hypothetical protein [Dehalococcoidia bacterium]
MKKRQKSGGKPVRLKKVLSTAEIDKVLDDLDKAMLSGDEKRMESLIGQLPEENDQVAEIITRRIVDGSARVPIFAFEMLGIFGGSQTEDYFKRIAEDRAVDDLTRFGARRFLGW